MPNLDVVLEGKEIFAQWTHYGSQTLPSQNFYVDSNGLEILKKDIDLLTRNETIAKHLVPVTSMIATTSNHFDSEYVLIVYND